MQMPVEISDVQLAFPTSVKGLLPDAKDIPREFYDWTNKYAKVARDMFYNGGRFTKIVPVEGMNPGKALRHIQYCLGSFEPKHEVKIAGVAYLLSLWFTEVEFEPTPREKP